jgi:phosphatidylglycerol:prolipoprotein diacylglycerol transferase
MFPTLIQLGSFRLATYGVFVASGYLAGILYLSSKREKMGIDEARFWTLIYWLFFGAILGGKLMYWAVEWRAVLSGELRLIADFRYGFVFYGGFLGAALVGIPAARRLKRPYLDVADYFGVALPLGHAVGRLGCFMAGCCSGAPSSLPWAVRFTHPDSLVSGGLRGVPLHPVQLYEAAGGFVIAALISRLIPRIERGELRPGTAAIAYMGAYALLRFFLEFFRGDPRGGFWLGMSVSQRIALLCLVFAAAALVKRGWRTVR